VHEAIKKLGGPVEGRIEKGGLGGRGEGAVVPAKKNGGKPPACEEKKTGGKVRFMAFQHCGRMDGKTPKKKKTGVALGGFVCLERKQFRFARGEKTGNTGNADGPEEKLAGAGRKKKRGRYFKKKKTVCCGP